MIRFFRSHFAIILILLVSAAVRLYQFDRPLADWHSWRQADTASVTREYVKNGVDLLEPQYHDLSNIPSGMENPDGYRMVEFPLVNAAVAISYPYIGMDLPIHVFSRLVNIDLSLGSVLLIYLIVLRLVDKRTAIFSAASFGLLPYNIFFHTTVLPEIALVFFSLLATYLWILYLDKDKLWLLLATAVAAALALLIKPIFVFMGPAFLYLLWLRKGISGFLDFKIYLALILSIAPLIAWRWWILQFPEGIPAAGWLLNSDGIRFKGAFFRWLFAERIGHMILGYWGLILFGVGMISKARPKSGWFFHYWLLGMIMYLSVFATGNVTHDYYQIFIIPIFSIFVGMGLNRMLYGPFIGLSKTMSRLLAVVSVGFMLAFGWFAVRDFFNINNPAIVQAGQAVDQLTPADSLVIAPYMGDTAFLYQTNRRGWPIGFNIEDRIAQGATHYVSTSYDDEARWLEDSCDVIEHTDNFILISLEQCKFEADQTEAE